MKSPLLFLAGCFALGILVAEARPGGALLYLSACGAGWLAGGFALRRNWRTASVLLILAGFVFAGASRAGLFRHRFPENHVSRLAAWGFDLSQPVNLDGIITTNPLQMPYGLQFDVAARRISDGTEARSVSGKIRLRVYNGWKSVKPAASLGLHYGDRIVARVRLRRPHNYQNPGSFNYRRWLESIQDIYWQGAAAEPSQVKKLAGPDPAFFGKLIQDVRQRLSRSIDQLYPPWSLEGRDGAVLKAVLLGDRSSLDSNTIENFRKSGLYHLLVVAGLHVGLLAMLAEALLRLLRLGRTSRTVLLMISLGFYATLVDERAPTLRATLMIGAYLLARLLDREQPALNAIGLAALILLADRPAWLLDSGFQLSFAAALLIAAVAVPVLNSTTEPYRRALWHIQDVAWDVSLGPRQAQFRLDIRAADDWLQGRIAYFKEHPGFASNAVTGPLRAAIWVIDLVIFSAVVQLGLLLPMTEIFHRVTLAGIGLNTLAIPLMTILLAIAVPAVVLNTLVPALAAVLAKLLAMTMTGLFWLTETPQLPHWLSFRVPASPVWVAWGFGLSVVALACAFFLGRRVLMISAAVAAIFGLLVALCPFAPRTPRGMLQVTDLDCGGGEALFIVFPDGSTMLAGTGGGSGRRLGGGDPFRAQRWDPGENIVSPYLWSRGVKRIDVLALTRSRDDDFSGADSILRNFRVKEFWYGEAPRPRVASSLFSLLKSRHIQTRRLEAGQVIAFHETVIQVTQGGARSDLSRGSQQSAPLVLRIFGPQGSLLLAGDLSNEEGSRLLKSPSIIASETLQLPRHAVPPSLLAELLSRVEPRIALAAKERENEEADINLVSDARDPQAKSKIFAVDRGAVTVSMTVTGVSVQRYHSQEP
ncbi:MAG TPA: ComEC/Rec2 family competence protein [Terriglobia bacterium]|nr:ComEC/Rec2 family competence protein [Terriglobia bacterium]